MNSQFSDSMLKRISDAGVIAVIVVDEAAQVVPLARALIACGIDAMELTLRTPAAIEALRLVREEVPEMLAGVGTVLTPTQIDEVMDAGAEFAVAPGLNPRVVQHAQSVGLPFAPGVATPSEIERAIDLGCRELKFFPAEPIGGIQYLKSMCAPYSHLGLKFIPLGGIDASKLGTYLNDPTVLAVGGSWIAPRSAIQNSDWSVVIDRATESRRIAKERVEK